MSIIDFVKEIWDKIKKIVLKILSFIKNILSFFKQKHRAEMLRKHKDLLAVTVKDRLANGDYRVINCLFNKATNKIVSMEMDAQGYKAERLDSETQEHFGDKDMLILT